MDEEGGGVDDDPRRKSTSMEKRREGKKGFGKQRERVTVTVTLLYSNWKGKWKMGVKVRL